MLPMLDSPELVFGLCSPIGTENAQVVEFLRQELLTYSYKPHDFKVTKLMGTLKPIGLELINTATEPRYDSHIKYANRLREITKTSSLLGMVCCAAIRSHRRKSNKKADKVVPQTAYIFDQFKRKEELAVLRQVYGKLFIVISIYSDRNKRIQYLARRISIDENSARVTNDHESRATVLVSRDENEEGDVNGQRLREAFPLADLFLNLDDINNARNTIRRFLQSFFGSNRISPTKDEYGIYIAKSASLRSLDLSRQVGAAIFSPHGEIITLGCNEVPKAGGGTYWTDDIEDARDYTLGRDENELVKRALLADVVKRLIDGKLIKVEGDPKLVVDYVVQESMKKDGPIREALMLDVLEFGRTIHAEMSAIADSARIGRSVHNATLYSTTFPCHVCARHIIAAGIARVVFIEPYPKSYAEHLHKEISISTDPAVRQKVHFSPFIGISPVRFRDLFERGRRKDITGKFTEWASGTPKPIIQYTFPTYVRNEEVMVALFRKILKAPDVAKNLKIEKVK